MLRDGRAGSRRDERGGQHGRDDRHESHRIQRVIAAREMPPEQPFRAHPAQHAEDESDDGQRESCRNTIRRTASRSAPTAIRMPISFVRRAGRVRTSPYNPTIASTRPIAPMQPTVPMITLKIVVVRIR